MPYFELKKGELTFPPAHFADLDGLLAVGGDISAERLLRAYQNGLYYWHHPMKHVKWWSPDPRIVLEPLSVQAPQPETYPEFTTSSNSDFEGVLRLCQQQYNREGAMTPAWLSERMFRIFMELDQQGLVHSQEIRREGAMIGGFFGVCLGGMCFGEYAVETVPGAATFAVLHAALEMKDRGVQLMDMQKETARADHLEYDEVSRVAFVDRCKVAASEYKTTTKTDLS